MTKDKRRKAYEDEVAALSKYQKHATREIEDAVRPVVEKRDAKEREGKSRINHNPKFRHGGLTLTKTNDWRTVMLAKRLAKMQRHPFWSKEIDSMNAGDMLGWNGREAYLRSEARLMAMVEASTADFGCHWLADHQPIPSVMLPPSALEE